MRRLLPALTLLIAGSLHAAAHPPSILSPEQEKATIEEVVIFRKHVTEAIARKDAAALRNLYAANFVHTHGSGKQDNRDGRIVSVLAGDPVIETAPVEDLTVRIIGGWTAVATGLSPIKSLADGKTYQFIWTAIYTRTDTFWQVGASHATRLNEIKP